mgnify:CR=1 FL=1
MDPQNFKLSLILGFSIVLLHFSLLKKGEKSSLKAVLYIFMGSYLFITIVSSLIALYEKSDAKEKIKAFYNGKTIIYKTGALKRKQNYLVLKKEGWSIYEDEFFKKDDLLLEIINCEAKERR